MTSDAGRRTDNWIMLSGAWVLLLVSLNSDPTPRMVGTHLVGAFLVAIGFAASAWHWGVQGLGLEEWLLLITCVALVLTLNLEAVSTGGVLINTTPLVIVAVPVLRRLL